MSNYTKENLKEILPSQVKPGTLAIKIGNEVFTAGNVIIKSNSVEEEGGNAGGEGGGNVSQSNFELVKITEYTPYQPEFSEIEKVIVQGPGNYENEYGDSYDFSVIDGTYEVTDDTKHLTGISRIYKQLNGNNYLRAKKQSEDDVFWYIYHQVVEYPYDSIVYFYSLDIPEGSNNWYSDWMGMIPVTITVTNATYPEQQQVLYGIKAEDYDFASKKFSFVGSPIPLSGFEKTPSVSGVYAMKEQKLFGNMITYVDDFVGGATLFAIEAAQGVNDLVNGGSPTIYGDGQEVLQDGEFCFDNVRAFQYMSNKNLEDIHDFTIEMDYCVNSGVTGYTGLFCSGDGWYNGAFIIQWGRYGYAPSLHWNGVTETAIGESNQSVVNDGKYHHLAITRKGSLICGFVDGKKHTIANSDVALNLNIISKIYVGVNKVDGPFFPGRMKHFRVCNVAIYEEDFSDDLPYWVGATI